MTWGFWGLVTAIVRVGAILLIGRWLVTAILDIRRGRYDEWRVRFAERNPRIASALARMKAGKRYQEWRVRLIDGYPQIDFALSMIMFVGAVAFLVLMVIGLFRNFLENQ
jgi:hypothetical protein